MKTLIVILVLFSSSIFGEIIKTRVIPSECLDITDYSKPKAGCVDFDGYIYLDTDFINKLGIWHEKTDYNSIEEVLIDKKLFEEKKYLLIIFIINVFLKN